MCKERQSEAVLPAQVSWMSCRGTLSRLLQSTAPLAAQELPSRWVIQRSILTTTVGVVPSTQSCHDTTDSAGRCKFGGRSFDREHVRRQAHVVCWGPFHQRWWQNSGHRTDRSHPLSQGKGGGADDADICSAVWPQCADKGLVDAQCAKEGFLFCRIW